MKKNNSGITLGALVITIIVMMIIASISVYEGKELIQQSKLQTLETNMLTIQAKAKAYAEEIESKVWTLNENEKEQEKDNFYRNNKGLEKKPETDNLEYTDCVEYIVTKEGLDLMGLSDLEEDAYVIIFDAEDKVKDIKYENGSTRYTLSDIKEILEGE